MPRGALLILFAAFIDGAQIAVGLLSTGLGAVVGTTAGIWLGLNICGGPLVQLCVLIGGVLGSVLNMFAAPVAIPAMTLLGMVLGVIISLIGGAALSFALGMEGMLYPTYAIPGFLGEVIPGLDWLPVWTTVAILSVLRKKAEEGEGGIMGTVATGVTAAATAAKGRVGEAAQMANRAATQVREGSGKSAQPPMGRTPQQLTDVSPRTGMSAKDTVYKQSA